VSSLTSSLIDSRLIYITFRVHYIPLSSSYSEIYNIHAYFSGATKGTLESINSTLADLPTDQRRSVEGDKRLRRIARAGKKWKQTVGRTLDLEGVFFTLLRSSQSI